MEMSDLIGIISVTVIISAAIYGLIQGIVFVLNYRQRKREEYLKSFDTVVAQLSSDIKSSQLAAAILLRRYFSDEQNKRNKDLHDETINVISALLRTLPTGVLQKTLGDGLAYARNLSGADLQKANMQDIYLGHKVDKIQLVKTDMFMADLSYALLENIEGQGAVFYHSILFNAKIKKSDFSSATFCGADLTGVRFTDVKLLNANFSGAINVPTEIAAVLNEKGECTSEKLISTSSAKNGKTIFFSMPGNMSKTDELMTKAYRDYLVNLKFDVIYYQKDNYPEFGQFNKIRESILKSSAMIAFGLKQLNVKDGTYYPGTSKEMNVTDITLSTPWNELEVGMGLMTNMPILLVHDPKISSGIFDEKLSECFVANISSEYDFRKLGVNKELARWIEKI